MIKIFLPPPLVIRSTKYELFRKNMEKKEEVKIMKKAVVIFSYSMKEERTRGLSKNFVFNGHHFVFLFYYLLFITK